MPHSPHSSHIIYIFKQPSSPQQHILFPPIKRHILRNFMHVQYCTLTFLLLKLSKRAKLKFEVVKALKCCSFSLQAILSSDTLDQFIKFGPYNIEVAISSHDFNFGFLILTLFSMLALPNEIHHF